MATQFLMNGNYEDAIVALKKIRTPSAATTVNLQKASFFRAIQLIRNGSYSKALPHLQESVKRGDYNTSLKHLAEFWIAECLYRRDEFNRSKEILVALQSNSRFRNSAEYCTSIYNLGYCQFKMGLYAEAAATFGKYVELQQSQRPYTLEANTRLADCHFMMKEYQKAAELYEKCAVEENYNNLYAPLQGAIAYGLLNDNARKIALLEQITDAEHRNSPLYTSAIYELGRTLVQNVEDEKAEKVLQKLISNPKDSTFYYKALLEMGMINANRQNYDSALDYYKTIVAKNPVSEEGQSALAGIENIYQSRNKPQEFLY
jgi:TolA-binding protein